MNGAVGLGTVSLSWIIDVLWLIEESLTSVGKAIFVISKALRG